MNVARPPPRTIAVQLAITIAGTIIILQVASLWITYRLVQSRIERDAVTQVLTISSGFADQSAFATLVAQTDPQVSRQLLTTFSRAPDVESLILLDATGRTLDSVGTKPSMPEFDRTQISKPTVLLDSQHEWGVVAPIIAATHQESLDTERKESVIGYLIVVVSKLSMQNRVSTIMLTSAAVGISLGLFAALATLWATNRTIAPLRRLTSVIGRAHKEGSKELATVEGATELRTIAVAYNELMTTLRQQSEQLSNQAVQLEVKVLERTHQLQEATVRAQSAERYKSALMATVSHEMKTPLHAIICLVEDTVHELEFIDDADKVRMFQKQIANQAVDLHAKISDILELARAEAGKLQLSPSTINMPTFLAELEMRMRPLAMDNGNRLVVHHEGCVDIDQDRAKLMQVLTNLLSNACKFTEQGEIALRVTCLDESVLVLVKDTGRGIEGCHIESMFEEFRQISMGEGRAFPGSGLGLAIVKRYVDAMGGTIEVDSTVNVGTTFTLRLPILELSFHPAL